MLPSLAPLLLLSLAQLPEAPAEPRSAAGVGQIDLLGAPLAGPFHLLTLPAGVGEEVHAEVLECDAEGRFRYPRHAAGTLLLLPLYARMAAVAPPGLEEAAWKDVDALHRGVLVPPDVAELTLQVSVHPHLEVLVAAAEDGAPLPNLRLVAFTRRGSDHASLPLTCASDGVRRMPRAALHGLDRIGWGSWGYRDNGEADDSWPQPTIPELLRLQDPLRLEVPHAKPFHLDLVGPDGPVAAAASLLWDDLPIEPTATSGRWLLQRDLPQRSGVVVTADGYLPSYVDKESLQGDGPLKVALEPETRLDVVLEEAVSPLGWSVLVGFDLADVPASDYLPSHYPPTLAPGVPDDYARADYATSTWRNRRWSVGTWTLDLAPAGRRTLAKLQEGGLATIELRHFGRLVERRSVELADGQRTEVAFRADGREELLTCVVVDEAGAPIVGAEVQVAPRRAGIDPKLRYRSEPLDDTLAPRLRTDEAGTVSLPLPANDGEVVRFRRPGYADTVVPLSRLRADGGRIVLRPGRDVILSVLGTDGQPFYGGFSNGFGAYYSRPWVHLGHGLWTYGEWREAGPDGEEFVAYRDWIFTDLPAGVLEYRIESVDGFRFLHDSDVRYAKCVAPISADDIPYGK